MIDHWKLATLSSCEVPILKRVLVCTPPLFNLLPDVMLYHCSIHIVPYLSTCCPNMQRLRSSQSDCQTWLSLALVQQMQQWKKHYSCMSDMLLCWGHRKAGSNTDEEEAALTSQRRDRRSQTISRDACFFFCTFSLRISCCVKCPLLNTKTHTEWLELCSRCNKEKPSSLRPNCLKRERRGVAADTHATVHLWQ